MEGGKGEKGQEGREKREREEGGKEDGNSGPFILYTRQTVHNS